MNAKTPAIASLLCACALVRAESIDLSCADLASEMIGRLASEGLLDAAAGGGQRAREISMELCTGAEQKARQQHEADKQEALQNWLTQPTGGKAGNERLKRLKR